jgi:outer membrane phospholipase A
MTQTKSYSVGAPTRRAGARRLRSLLVLLACTAGVTHGAHAAIALLQPARVVDGTKPLVLKLLVSADTANRNYLVPEQIAVTASAGMQPPVRIVMRRVTPGPDTIRLRQGEHRTIEYSGDIPPTLRGEVRLEPVDIDAAPVLVTLNRAPDAPASDRSVATTRAAEQAARQAAETASATGEEAVIPVVPPGGAAAPMVAEADLRDRNRLSFNDPMYFLVGGHGGANAKFQFSFKYRIFEGENPASKDLLDNLYLGYTQFSLWDLSSESKPFRDTNLRPSLFYYLSDLGVRNGAISRLSLATGLEHESNGRDGDDSRSINTVFVKPTFYLGDQTDWHWTVTPKVYYYLSKNNNADIGHYRGYMDLKLAYGKPDSWEFATTLRKGSRKSYGSVDAQVSYPLARLLPGTAGYLMAGYFVGYGESLLDYNRKLPWQFRLGYALNR